jgi:3-hydroxy-3-methylglutaryl CoA synthase
MADMDIGITAYGAYIPIYRLSGEALNQVWRTGGRGEKAVANFDEDSLTMGVEAGRDCLKGLEKEKDSIDAIYFASTTPPFKEKQSASIMAAALDLREDVITVDITDSLRSGSIAMRMALDSVKAGSARKVLVIAAELRIPPPNSRFEPLLGDGAAAFLVGGEGDGIGVVAQIEASYNIYSEFIDTWRMEYDKMIRSWEDRFIREEGNVPYLQKAMTGVLKSKNVSVKDIVKVAFPAMDARVHGVVARGMGLGKDQIQDPLFGKVGHTGAAFAPMILVGALEDAKPEDRILFANYGDGADAYILRVTKEIENITERMGIKRNLESKMILGDYGRYLKFRQMLEFEHTPDYSQRTSLSQIWRERKWVYRFHGHKCKKCGRIQFPMQKRCIKCQAAEEFLEEIPLSDRKGTLVTYSMDDRSPVVDPPNVLAAVKLEGGGRFFSQMTDRDTSKLNVGIAMEITFRRIHDALGVHNYFWKCKPARG